MADVHGLMRAESTPGPLVIRTIGVMDLKDALARGMSDFSAMPTHALFVCLIYPIVGLMLARVTFGYDVLSLLFPLAAGFALLGPFAAIGLYELSRQREQGLDPSWQDAFDVLHVPSRGASAFCCWWSSCSGLPLQRLSMLQTSAPSRRPRFRISFAKSSPRPPAGCSSSWATASVSCSRSRF